MSTRPGLRCNGRVLPKPEPRDNDLHTSYAHGLARAVLGHHPEEDPEVVRRAIPADVGHDAR